MKRTSLLLRLILLFLGASLLMFVLLNTMGIRMLENALTERTKTELYKEANLLVSEYLADYYGRDVTFHELSERLLMLAAMTEMRIWLVNNSGAIIFDSSRQALGQNILGEEKEFLEQTFLTDSYIKGCMSEPMLCVNQPIWYDYTKKGYLTLLVPMNTIYVNSVYYVDFVNICYLIFLLFLFLVFARIYLLTAVPVTKMTNAAREFSRSDFKEPLKLDYLQEYRELGNTIQYMGDRLKNADDEQRKFISNVSHDFRSPLTSIKGYVEAMKDGTIPAEMQEKYLDIVLYETERLTKLTENLLELNSFDDAGIHLHPTVFDINQQIKQVALAFEGTFKKKKLVLNLVFSQKEQLVEADMDKIQQVLYNLIDNAGKFSNPDASIRITTEEKGNKVLVAVKDYGIGIPKESIERIWERFYKTDASRGKDKKGTGLGLAIVKEIISVHGENISVVSTEGVGTEFVFTLPRVED